MVPVIDSEVRWSKLDDGHGGTMVMRGGAPSDSDHDGLGQVRLWLHGDLADLASAD